MSRRRKIEIDTPEEAEGWESLAEEASGGSLEPSAELEEALREAADAVEERPASGPPPDAPAEPGAGRAGEAGDEGAEADSEDTALELKQTQDRLLRLQADFENYRRRALKEHTEAHQYGHQNLVKDLLSSVDNLDRAIEHAKKSGGGDLESLLQGVELVRRELLTALGKHGVVIIEALGQPFDPSLHEAMAQAPDESVAPNTVVQELQKGYKLRDRLIRPARVIVARAPDEVEAVVEAERDTEAEPAQEAVAADESGEGTAD
jgi:molecular chaperone GrpE